MKAIQIRGCGKVCPTREMGALKIGSHLNIYHGNNDRKVKGLHWDCGERSCREEMISNSTKAGQGALGSSSSGINDLPYDISTQLGISTDDTTIYSCLDIKAD